MKIAMTTMHLPGSCAGGVPTYVHCIANELVRREHTVDVYSLFSRPDNADYNVVQIILPRVLRKMVEKKNGLGIYIFPVFLAFRNFDNYDVIHSHGDSHFLITKTPVVRTFHSSGLDMALRSPRLVRALGLLGVYLLEILSGIQAKKRTFISKSGVRYFPFHPHKIIPSAIDLSLFRPSDGKSSRPSILFVAGSMGTTKRGALLVDALSKVREEIPDAELWMVCRERGNGEGIKWLGNKYREELVKLYQQAWSFCLPSSYETFGTPYIEAMACGTPVVATPNQGAKEVLENGKYGVIVQPENLSDALIKLLTHRELRAELTERGLHYVQRFSMMNIVDQYEKLYASVVRERYSR